jgi:hypothetical protein
MKAHPSRWLVLLLAAFLSFFTWNAPVGAAQPVATSAAPVVVAGIFDGIVGNRSKMIQFTFVGFAIAVAILMTATRKH